MPAPVLSVLNMKGGVGKTTVSAHIMRVLYRRLRKRVLLVDLDAQFNLTQTVMTQDHYDTLPETKTVKCCFEPLPSDDFFQVTRSNDPPPEAGSIRHRLWKIIGHEDTAHLDLIPGSFELMKFSMIDDPNQLNHASTYLTRFLSQSRMVYDLIVLDCNPSTSFVTKCALENSTHVLSPVRPDKFSLQGVGMVNKLFEHLNLDVTHMILVNGVKRTAPMTAVEQELRAHTTFGPKVLVNNLNHSKLLSADPNYTGFATDKRGPYSSVLQREISRIVQELSNHLGLE